MQYLVNILIFFLLSLILGQNFNKLPILLSNLIIKKIKLLLTPMGQT